MTGTSLILGSIKYVFPGGRTYKLFKAGLEVTNSTNLLVLGKNITLTILDCCAPPSIRLAAHCIAGGASIVASIISPNPITIGAAIHIAEEIYDKC
jgi:hypothetical protein